MEKLGNLEVNELGIGTWAWGDRFVWGYHGQSDDPVFEETFKKALELGVNFFDTAELYGFGRSETLLGRFLKNVPQKPIIATKFMPLPWKFNKSQLLSALHRSLKRLDLPQVGLYQIHWPSRVPLETWMDGLADAVDAKLTQNVGVSNYSVEETKRAHAALAKRGIPLASNQVEYHLLDRKIEKNGLLDVCNQLGVRIIAYSPLGMGLLTGKYTPENPPSGMRKRWYNADYLKSIQPLIGLMRELGSAHGDKTPAQVAINWTMCKGTIPIPGAKNIKQLTDNLGAMGWRLTADEVKALDAAADKISG